MNQVLVACKHSKYLAHVFVPNGLIYDLALSVFAGDTTQQAGVLHSTIYEVWVRQYASSLETRMRYTTTDCFETFPFPESSVGLEELGEQYHLHRQEIMMRRQEGLTKTYNRFHDPHERAEDIAALRDLHAQMDRAVAVAYGWGDLDLGHGFHQTKQGTRFTISEAARQVALGRLLALNHQRYAEEVALGLHDKGAKGAKKGMGGQGRAVQAEGAAVRVPSLFDADE